MRPALDLFEGAWVFDRVVTHASGDRATVTGRAVFSPCEDGLRYDETGEMSLNGGPALTATRRYVWTAGGEVLFEDGRPFHALPAPGQEAEHWCDPDLYRVRYDFADWPRWSAEWQVSGPRKDYRMRTTYARP